MTQLLLFETGGKQSFIFSANKLTDSVGASQLIQEAGTDVVLRAVRDSGGPDLTGPTRSAVRDNIREARGRPGQTFEVVYAASGTALLIVPDEPTAREVVARVTSALLTIAPGLDITGAFVPLDANRFTEALTEVYRSVAAARSARAQANRRFSRLPFVAPCRHTGLPAFGVATIGDDDEVSLSRESMAKRAAAPRWAKRIDDMLAGFDIPNNLTDLDRSFTDLDWLAVVHADGNGMGRMFQSLGERTGDKGPALIEHYRSLSLAVEEITEEALSNSLNELRDAHEPRRLRAMPIVVGGDDFTLICDGELALPFARAYLLAFENASRLRLASDAVLSEATEGAGLTATAGVAITKRHFPFSAGYDLAEALTGSAKAAVKNGNARSALDFHILYDSTYSDFESIRQHLHISGLTRKPFVVSHRDKPVDRVWAGAHDLQVLMKSAQAIRAGTREGGGLPNSQLHELRDGLHLGREEANSRLGLIRHRYAALQSLLEDDGTLFHPTLNSTVFLDALESASFWLE